MPLKIFRKLNCCEKCQNYWSCEKKWYRGEHKKENVCCELCVFYETCWAPALEQKKKKK
jgi:hypothetical protein